MMLNKQKEKYCEHLGTTWSSEHFYCSQSSGFCGSFVITKGECKLFTLFFFFFNVTSSRVVEINKNKSNVNTVTLLDQMKTFTVFD